MKTYKEPLFRIIDLDNEALLAGSPDGGLTDGDNVGNKKPTGDNDGNFFAKGWNGRIIIDDEEDF